MNIEKTISEHAVSDILTPMLESQDRIVTEDVAPVFDQATGLDTPPASGTVTTTIEESRNLISAIIRKAWTATLTMLGGASVISSIAAAYTYLRNRLQGNETYGIPDRRSEISASSPLAANLALLNDRKMYDGLYDANGDPVLQDGESLIALLTNSARAARVVEIRDTNSGWTNNKDLTSLLTLFPNAKTLRCKFKNSTTDLIYSNKVIENLYLDEYEGGARIVGNGGYGYGVKNLYAPKMTWLNAAGGYTPSFGNKLVHLYAPTWAGWNGYASTSYGIVDCPDMIFAEIGDWTDANTSRYLFYNCPNLIEVRLNEQSHSLNLQSWSPTLDSSNLQQFLSNFRDYIALRLKGGYPIGQGPILTLSQAVHNAITAAEDDYHIREIITQKGWTISPAPN